MRRDTTVLRCQLVIAMRHVDRALDERDEARFRQAVRQYLAAKRALRRAR